MGYYSLFTKMVPKAEKKAPAPPKAKAKALKAKKAVLKGIHSHTHTHTKVRMSPTSDGPRHGSSEGSLHIL